MSTVNEQLRGQLIKFASGGKKIVVLAGAGISAESGIPTFRGDDGIWTIGSTHHVPTEMGTRRMLLQHPTEVWKWKLHYYSFFKKASPNPGHYAIAQLETLFGDRFRLITQNIDGLHVRAGSTEERMYQIHGNMHKVRCLAECSEELYPSPDVTYQKGDEWTEELTQKLSCPKCGGFLRPHVLLFDEYYDEANFKWDSSLTAARESGLLIIAGTMLATGLPQNVLLMAKSVGAICLNVNVSEHLEFTSPLGAPILLKGSSSEVLPEIASIFSEVKEDLPV